MDTDWIAPALSTATPLTWASFIPAGFEAYVRVLHPPGVTSNAVTKPLTWREIAAEQGVSLGPFSRWEDIASDSSSDQKPLLGNSPPEVLHPILRALDMDSPSSRTWLLAYWNGYGGRPCESTPECRLELPGRAYTVCGVSVDDFGRLLGAGQSPNLIWPSNEGRPQSVVVIEVDDRSTIVAGSRRLGDMIRDVAFLECLEIEHSSTRFHSP